MLAIDLYQQGPHWNISEKNTVVSYKGKGEMDRYKSIKYPRWMQCSAKEK